MNRFGYNGRTEGENFINDIVTGDVTPNQLSEKLIGARPGEKGISSQLVEGIAGATGNDPTAQQAMRGAIWNRLRGAAEGETARSPEKVASDVYRFIDGPGRDVARRLYSPAEHGVLRNYADVVRQSAQARGAAEEIAKNTRPVPVGVERSPIEELANRVLGSGRQKSDEGLFDAINAYAKSGNRADVRTLAGLLGGMTRKQRADLRSALIRNIGQSPTGEFSLPQFVKDWNGYSDRGRSLLFGSADGPYRKSLDDIATIAARYRDVGRKFGNPSGSGVYGTITAFAGLALTNPLMAIKAAGLGGAGWTVSKILASPVGAAKMSRMMKVADVVSRSTKGQGAVALRTATTDFVNTLDALDREKNR
jgi:hypothetical protein